MPSLDPHHALVKNPARISHTHGERIGFATRELSDNTSDPSIKLQCTTVHVELVQVILPSFAHRSRPACCVGRAA